MGTGVIGIPCGKMLCQQDGNWIAAGHRRAPGTTTALSGASTVSRQCRLGKMRALAVGRGHLKEQFQIANNLIDNYLITFDRKLSLRT